MSIASPRSFIPAIMWLSMLSVLHFTSTNARAQQTPSDSLRLASDDQKVIYEIAFSRLRRLVVDIEKEKRKFPENEKIIDIIADAIKCAENGDYDIATEYADYAIDLLSFAAEAENVDFPMDKTDNAATGPQVDYEAFWGADLWQQKFGIAFDDTDSTLFESEGNPFAGFRLFFKSLLTAKTTTQGNIEGKLSNQYNTLQANINHEIRHSPNLNSYLRNRFEATDYKRNDDLQYVYDRLIVGGTFKTGERSSIELEEELQVRNYAVESDFFQDFLQNEIKARLGFAFYGVGRSDLMCRLRQRRYGSLPDKNYGEHIFEVDYWPLSLSKSSLYTRLQGRIRSYQNGYVDSLFTNDFREIYGELVFRENLSDRFGLRLEAEVESRHYQYFSTATPDYSDVTVFPSFSLSPAMSWSINFGYRYRNRLHRLNGDNENSVEIEDYFSHGPSLSIDIFTFGGFMASISNTFELRRYPNAPAENGTGLSLYSNRNINSLFLFVTWNLSDHWLLNLFSTIDDDDDRNLEGSDSRSNLVNIELSFKF
jgi:hypothetical protein